MLLEKLLQLPSPAGNLDILKQFANTLIRYDIDRADIPELLKIATDAKLYDGTDREFFAMHYALYALGALKQVAICPTIIDHLNCLDAEDEWISSYISVFELMGENAIPYLIQACRFIRAELLFVLTESLAKLANLYPACRTQVLHSFDDILYRMQEYSKHGHTTALVENTLLMSWLNMKAIERIETIREIQSSHHLAQHVTQQIDALAKGHHFESV